MDYFVGNSKVEKASSEVMMRVVGDVLQLPKAMDGLRAPQARDGSSAREDAGRHLPAVKLKKSFTNTEAGKDAP